MLTIARAYSMILNFKSMFYAVIFRYPSVSLLEPDWARADADADDVDFQLPEHLRSTGQDNGEEVMQ
ncbi:hypothetical protein CE195_03840 [Sodalis-like symbiont of Philaenus spumarius]|nr:hypothetical protein CE195_03840 [Sodalis-like symbiont of Philaenus spumarius]